MAFIMQIVIIKRHLPDNERPVREGLLQTRCSPTQTTMPLLPSGVKASEIIFTLPAETQAEVNEWADKRSRRHHFQ